MANNKQVGSSFPSPSASFTADLFGAKESPSSSAGVFASIFPPPSTVLLVIGIQFYFFLM